MNKECFKKCLENGINYFDTAEIYGYGKGEIQFGKVLKDLIFQEKK